MLKKRIYMILDGTFDLDEDLIKIKILSTLSM